MPWVRVYVAGSRCGLVAGRQDEPWCGRIDSGPNWSKAKHRSGNFEVTSSIRSSLASLSGSVDSFHVRVRWKEMSLRRNSCRSRSRPMCTRRTGLVAR
jgi:hypothetical protein